ncbi:ABC transporter substrate-binding protein [Paenibacillus swuensis]|uniref:ABC transporter substrate-binding protein n=1 Tax=Paenibacillus swuensis TaxID=1178515 RepID=A0A172TFM8_9BACL|nr:extracellular solute-binding protein [Paenibacillus swuensis]ANE45762.1 ABC transporter substrate-binding protein [Paenibacillus swuensis]
MKNRKSVLLALTAFMALSAVLSGCGNAANDPETGAANAGNKNEPKVKEPTEFSMMSITYESELPQNDNPVELEMEKRTNTKMDVTFVPANNYGDKIKVTLASGDIPDVMLTTWIYDSVVLSAIKQGAFWDLTPYLKDYPNLLKTYPKESIDNTKVNGKVYGLPRPRPLVGGQGFPALRKDWLDKVGLQVPQTMDELYTVLKAFTEQDPDGNGKKDTYGFIGSVTESWVDKLVFVEDVFAGYNGIYYPKDGKMLYRDLLPSTREALVWLNKAYKEGVLAPDFAVIKNSQVLDYAKQGKVGMIPTAMDANVIGDWLTAVQPNAPKAEIVHVPTLVSPATGNKYYPKEGGHFGNYMISKKVSEEKLKDILAFFDYGASQEGMDLANFGFDPSHYKENAEGQKEITDEFKKIGGSSYKNIWTLVNPYSRLTPKPGYPKEYYARDVKVVEERLSVGTYLNTNGVESETEVKYGPEIGKKIHDMKMKVIVGKESLENWDKFVATMEKDPNLTKMLEEKYASYVKLYGDK